MGPRDAKRALARALVARFHAEEAAAAAEEHFDRVFVRHEAPEEMDEVAASGPARPPARAAGRGVRRLALGGPAPARPRAASSSTASVIEDMDLPGRRLDGRVLQLGKRRFARVRVTA